MAETLFVAESAADLNWVQHYRQKSRVWCSGCTLTDEILELFRLATQRLSVSVVTFSTIRVFVSGDSNGLVFIGSLKCDC